jgi:hypothetical protein
VSQPFRSCVSFDVDARAIDSYSPTMAKTHSGTRHNPRSATAVARSRSYRALYMGQETGGVMAPLGDVTALLRPHQAHNEH